MTGLTVRLVVFLAIWYYLTTDDTPVQREMSSLQFRIQQYRKLAEFFGKKVLVHEKRYYELADTNRMN